MFRSVSILGMAAGLALTATPAAATGGENLTAKIPCAVGSVHTTPAGVFRVTPHPLLDGTSPWYTVTAEYTPQVSVDCVPSGVTVVLRLDQTNITIYRVNLSVFTSQPLPVPAGPRTPCAWTASVYATGHVKPVVTFRNPATRQGVCRATGTPIR